MAPFLLLSTFRPSKRCSPAQLRARRRELISPLLPSATKSRGSNHNWAWRLLERSAHGVRLSAAGEQYLGVSAVRCRPSPQPATIFGKA